MKPATSDNDLGYNHILREAEKAWRGKPHVKVGMLQDNPSTHIRSGATLFDDEIDLVTLMLIHEFGCPKAGIPERSVIRSGVDKNERKLVALTQKVIGDVASGKTVEDGLGLLGVALQGLIRARFGSKDLEPLKRKRKRRQRGNSRFTGDRPLVDTGQMRAAISYEVVT